jgi:hypothetical protein
VGEELPVPDAGLPKRTGRLFALTVANIGEETSKNPFTYILTPSSPCENTTVTAK